MTDFGGRYQLVTLLGKGGFGEVWLAHDKELGNRPVAIKMLHSPRLAEPADVARFKREMQLTSRMQHPNIMTVFTTGSDNGVPFMVMEYLKGSDLGKQSHGWRAHEVARIGRETFSALAYAHGLDPGIVHRDIKPANLFVCDTGLVKVTDFGIAKAVSGTNLTSAQTLLGTLPYMAPEYWLGEAAAFSNDTWAVGCVLYELLSGRRPRSYATATEYVAAAARREVVPPLPAAAGVPGWLFDAVMAMLRPDPLARPTAAQCVGLLSEPQARSIPPAQVPTPTPLTRTQTQAQRPGTVPVWPRTQPPTGSGPISTGPTAPAPGYPARVTAGQSGSFPLRASPPARGKLLIAAGAAAVLVIGGVATVLSLPGSGSGSGNLSGSGAATGSVAATGPPGSLRWTYTTADAQPTGLAAAGGTVYASDGARVYAVNAATGHLNWASYLGSPSPSESEPVAAGSTVYIDDDSMVYALDAATGHLNWSHATSGSRWSAPAVANGTVYVAGGSTVYALNAANGHLDWSHATGASVSSGSTSDPSPAVAGSTVYAGSSGTVYALDAGTGSLRWSHAAAGTLTTPAVAGSTVYIGNDAGVVYALSAGTGHLDWSHDTSGAVHSSPAVAGSAVYVVTAAGKVYALSAATGHLDWSYGSKDNGLPVNFTLAAAGRTVYVSYTSTTAHELYALNAATGHLDWSYDTADTVYSSPVVAGSAVYVGNIDGNVDALNIGAG